MQESSHIPGTRVEQGCYRLTRDVINPDADRRKRHDWTAHPVFKAGFRFIVTEHTDRFGDGYCSIYARKGPSYSIYEHQPAYQLFCDACEPDPETPSEYLERRGTDLATLIDCLVQDGHVSKETLERLAAQQEAGG